MSWNYRLMKHTHVGSDGQTETWLAMHEVYYKDSSVKDLTVTSAEVGYTDAVRVVGENIDEVRMVLENMLKALDKPILEYKDH